MRQFVPRLFTFPIYLKLKIIVLENYFGATIGAAFKKGHIYPTVEYDLFMPCYEASADPIFHFILLRNPANTLDLAVYDHSGCRKYSEFGDFLKIFYFDNRNFEAIADLTTAVAAASMSSLNRKILGVVPFSARSMTRADVW